MPTTSISTSWRRSSPTPRCSRSTTPSACATPTARWVWLRARCELARQEGEGGLHLIGIAVDITEQKSLVEKTGRRRPAAARRHRDHPGGVRAVGRRQPPGAVQLELPATAPPARRGRGRRRLLRGRRRRRHASRSSAPRWRTRTANRPARAPSRRSSTTAAGCISASGAPRTAATSRSAPTSPRSSSTRRSWSKARSG